jgi:hypothetical protein
VGKEEPTLMKHNNQHFISKQNSTLSTSVQQLITENIVHNELLAILQSTTLFERETYFDIPSTL